MKEEKKEYEGEKDEDTVECNSGISLNT